MTVILQSASGAQESIYVREARTEAQACKIALAEVEQRRPHEGWRALHVL